MVGVIKFNNLPYNFRNAETLNKSNVNSVKYRTETIASLSAKIWKILPNNYKELTLLSTSKLKLGKQMNALADYAKRISCKLVLFDIVTSDKSLLQLIFLLFYFI